MKTGNESQNISDHSLFSSKNEHELILTRSGTEEGYQKIPGE